MQGVYSDTALVVPTDWLVWLATSSARMAMYRLEGWHLPFRLLHIASASAFFGAILLMDLRLLGVLGRDVTVAGLARLALPVTHVAFVLAMGSGAALFLYDPIQVGSHSYFLPKLLLIAAGLVNAGLFSLPERFGLKALPPGTLTRHARMAGALSLLLWTGVFLAASANHEERPLVGGRSIERPAIDDGTE